MCIRDSFAGLLITIPTLFVVGVVVERAFIARLKGPEKTAMSILVTYAVALVIEGALSLIFSTNLVQLQASYVNKSFAVGSIHFGFIYVAGFVMAAVLLSALYFMLYRTRFGVSVRASLADQTSAALVGIDVAITAAGGMIYGATNAFNPNSSYDLISRLLTIIVLGGMGSLSGAMLAGVSMVFIGDMVGAIWSPVWSTMSYFLVLVLVLLVRPQGLFGKKSARVA